jgi:ABC-type sugar transport system ATPase subunit
MTTRLELKDVVKSFEEVEAVKRISLALERGEFLSLLGPSGCGKSTTLSLIAGFLGPDEGEILVDGKLINRVPPQKRRIGLVFQDYAVFSRLSVEDNLSFGLEAQRVRRSERRRRVAEIAEKLDLVGLMSRRGSALNMSEMQRVAIARVLVTGPELLLLDEPMSNLDASVRASLRGELKQIQKDLDQTILYVTHDQVEAMAMSDRIAVMRHGEILQVGSPEDIYHRPVNRFVAEFIGDPPINLLDCEVLIRGGEVAVKTALHGPVEFGRAAIAPGHHLFAIRPHDLSLADVSSGDAVATSVRFVENFGSEHVLHVDYGEVLAAVTVEPYAAQVGETVYLRANLRRGHLIDASSERVVPFERWEAVA